MHSKELAQAVIGKIRDHGSDTVEFSLPLTMVYPLLTLIQAGAIASRQETEHLYSLAKDFLGTCCEELERKYPAIATSVANGWNDDALVTRDEFDALMGGEHESQHL